MKDIEKIAKEHSFKGVLLLIVLLTVYFGFWEKVERDFYDVCFRIRGEKDPGNQIIVVAMDEKSINQLGPLPWDRSIHTKVLDQLGTAKLVGFDILFDTYTNSLNDQNFAAALKNNGNVILASMFSFEKHKDGNWYQQLVKPIPELTRVAKDVGFINMPSNRNVVRSAALYDSNTYGIPYPSFNLALFTASKQKEISDLIIRDNKILLDKNIIHISNENQVIIDFWGPGKSFKTYSYLDVLNGKVAEKIFTDRIVLIGVATPTVKSDYYDNPYTSDNLILKEQLPVPGVEVHASAIQTYLENNSFRRVSFTFNILVLLSVFFLANYLNKSINSLWSYSLIFILILCIGGASYLLWYYKHIIVNTVAPIATVIVVSVWNISEDLIKSEIERRNTRAMFSRYVSSDVVDQILSEESISLNSSTNQEVTILFADLRNFTSYSEDRPPEEVVRRLNYYFKEVTEIIFHYGGTLDKYIGDSVMAIFGAPIPMKDHALQAVNASIEIVLKLEEISRDLENKDDEVMNIGIGINTGNVVAGSIGSEIRMEYTVIGEAVNLASRLENLSKEYKNGIIVGKSTVEKLNLLDKPNWKIKSLGYKSIKGLSKEIEVFILQSSLRDS